jgi:spermidine synthase
LIVGGGDGGSLTEVLRYPSVTECVQVEWDAEVVRMAKQHLPDLAAGYADPRTRLVVADIADYLRDMV